LVAMHVRARHHLVFVLEWMQMPSEMYVRRDGWCCAGCVGVTGTEASAVQLQYQLLCSYSTIAMPLQATVT
jgi:hypothetical protein